jgi:predicted nucleotidyltransferase
MWMQKAHEKGLIHLNANQQFIIFNCQYEAITGSMSYGVSTDDSDMDIVGWCIPPKGVIFPHLLGHIQGFGQQPQKFETWQAHHIKDGDKSFDFSCYNIVRYFSLCMDNNPNMVDTLFVPLRCITHSTEVGNLVREHRKLFLHKGCWQKFRGYGFSQMHKMENKYEKSKVLHDFEKKHNIPHSITIDEVIKEIEKRNLTSW